MLNDESPQMNSFSPDHYKGSPAGFYLYVSDADAVQKKALEAGATEVMPVTDMFWGDKMGCIQDSGGTQVEHRHAICARHEPQEIQKGQEAWLAEMAKEEVPLTPWRGIFRATRMPAPAGRFRAPPPARSRGPPGRACNLSFPCDSVRAGGSRDRPLARLDLLAAQDHLRARAVPGGLDKFFNLLTNWEGYLSPGSGACCRSARPPS
jgi:hypothetical protein